MLSSAVQFGIVGICFVYLLVYVTKTLTKTLTDSLYKINENLASFGVSLQRVGEILTKLDIRMEHLESRMNRIDHE